MAYKDYMRIEGLELPRHLTLTALPEQANAEQPAIEVRLVIDAWARVQ